MVCRVNIKMASFHSRSSFVYINVLSIDVFDAVFDARRGERGWPGGR